MHKTYAFDKLPRDFFRFLFGKWSSQILLQVALLEILHGNKDGLGSLVPAIGLYETMDVLLGMGQSCGLRGRDRRRRTNVVVGKFCDSLELPGVVYVRGSRFLF